MHVSELCLPMPKPFLVDLSDYPCYGVNPKTGVIENMAYSEKDFARVMSRVRRRPPPIDRAALYGDHIAKMGRHGYLFRNVADRAAYVYVTGTFPSHIRDHYVDVLRRIAKPFAKPSSFDGRIGNVKLKEEAVRDLNLDRHPMILAVRKRIKNHYLIQQSRGVATRRSYGQIYMFKLENNNIEHRITVQKDGSEKDGWGRYNGY